MSRLRFRFFDPACLIIRSSLACLLVGWIGLPVAAAEDFVRFDVPSFVSAKEIALAPDGMGDEKLVEVVIPVSSQIDVSKRADIQEFRFDIFWNLAAVTVADYGPKTQTTSGIEGLISIEKRNDRHVSMGGSLKSGYEDIVGATLKGDVINKRGITQRYTEIPQHDVLVASGTIKRGTGVFFRFHPSKQETLEGGRDLVVAYRVPSTWRGGILQIECRAQGEKKRFGPWDESINIGRSFVVPVYLVGDDQARELAAQFTLSQNELNAKWKRHLQRRHDAKGFKGEMVTLFGGASTKTVPDEWTQYLIQTGQDGHYDRYRRQLSQPVRGAAMDFMEVRQQLAKLSR